MGRLTRAADHSKLSLAAAAGLAVFGGPDGRRAATGGLVAVGVTATVVNVGLKLVARRRRPDPVPTALEPRMLILRSRG
jgi:undecaprenyl-diphosphatase